MPVSEDPDDVEAVVLDTAGQGDKRLLSRSAGGPGLHLDRKV